MIEEQQYKIKCLSCSNEMILTKEELACPQLRRCASCWDTNNYLTLIGRGDLF